MRSWLPLLALLVSLPAAGQTPSLTGTLTDPSGAVVPSALIQLRGPGGEHSTTSDRTGGFVFQPLTVGTYELRVIANGFAPVRKAVTVDRPTVVELRLAIAGIRQDLNVEDAARPGSDPAANGSAVVLRQREIAALSDDPDELAQQLEALAGPSPGPMGGQIYIDGFLGGNLPPKSSIREIRVNSNPYSTEYDSPGFGRVEIFTKPGTDTFRGDVMAQYNNQYLNARNPLLAQSRRSPFQAQLYQLNLGGPIQRHRSSFAMTAERRQINENALILATTLDNALNPLAISQALSTPLTRFAITPRIDYTIDNKNTLVVRYQGVRISQRNQGAGGFNLASRAFSDDRTENTLQITETAVLTPRTVNDSRFQLMYSDVQFAAASTAPGVDVVGAFYGGGATIGNSRTAVHSWEFTNLTARTQGRHALKWGARVRRSDWTDVSRANFSGTYIFYSLDQYRRSLSGLDVPSQFSLNAGVEKTAVQQTDVGLFVNDDWQVRSRLMLSYGIRYEAQTNIHDPTNFAPRLGLAWAVDGGKRRQPKTVLRAGFGLFFDRIPISTSLNALRYNGTTQQSYLILNPTFFPAIPSPGTLESSRQPQQIQTISSEIKAGRTYQGSLGIERQLGQRSRLTMSYVFSQGVNLSNSRNINAPLFTTVGEVYPFGDKNIRLQTESAGMMRLNQFLLNPTFSLGRLTLTGFYALSYGRNNNEGQPADPYNLRAEWGPSTSGDIRHRIMLMSTVRMPRNFSVSPVLIASSGQPYNITTGLDPYNTGVPAARPELIPGLTSADCRGGNFVYTADFGCFNLRPAPGSPVIPRNYGRGPITATLGLRLSHSWNLGGDHEVPPGMPFSASAGMGSSHDGPSGPSNSSKYVVTLSASALNALNRVNFAPPVGNLSSPYFGQSLSLSDLVGHMTKSSTYNRRIDLQLRFTF